MKNANPTSANSPAVPNWLVARASASPNAIALVVGEKSLTFQALYEHVQHSAGQLLTNGIQAGDRVALFLPNEPQSIAWIFALWHIGAVVVPLNRRLVAAEIAFQLQNVHCTHLIHDEALPKGLSAPQVKFLSGEAVAHDSSQANTPPAPQAHDDTCLIIHTSGTTGQAKGVRLSFGNLFYSAMASAYKIGVQPNDRWLCVLPLYHVGGLSILSRSVLYGTAIELFDGFDVAKLNHALAHHPVTLVSLVPTMLYRLLKARTEAWNPALRLVLLGGAAPSDEILALAQAQNIPLALSYGLTEAASQVCTALPNEVARKSGSVGKPLLFSQIDIQNENGDSLPANSYGEIVVTSPTVMQGYEGFPPSNGQIRTGDIGYLDGEGDLWLVQRRHDLILSGGENVYPSEVEKILLQHPAIQEACVVGLPHPEWGQQVAAALITQGTISEEELLAFCRQHLAGYKIPRQIRFVADFPRNAMGKIQVQMIRELF